MTDTKVQVGRRTTEDVGSNDPEKMRLNPTVSLVVIARNEVEHIGKCLEAAVQVAREFEGEVVFVDCDSKDGTLEIAKAFPVRVIKMSPETVLSAAAARRVGTLNSTGEFIIFIDGDCVLDPGWGQAAIRTLVGNPGMAGVTGRLDEVYLRQGVVIGEKADPSGHTPDYPEATLWVGGNATYRRSALELVDGGFDPSIRSQEEAELCFRLMKKGQRIFSIPEKMVTHYTEKRWTFQTVTGRFTRGLCIGYGQVLRSSLRHGFLLDFVRRESRTFLFSLACAAGIAACAVDYLRGRALLTPLWAALMSVPFIYMALKNRSAKWPALMYLTWFLNCVGMVQGVVKVLPHISECNMEFSVLKSHAYPHKNPDVCQPVRDMPDVG